MDRVPVVELVAGAEVGDTPERRSLVVVVSLQAVEARRAVQYYQVDLLGELGGVVDLGLFYRVGQTGAQMAVAIRNFGLDAVMSGTIERFAAPGEGEVVSCGACHATHAVAPADSLAEEGEAMRAMNATCVSCHETQRLPADAHHSEHAGCYACHDPHGVAAPDDPDSWMAPRSQPEVCGACHDSVSTVFMSGIHGQALMSGETEDMENDPPTCTSCHGAHPIAGTGDRGFSEAAVENCATCHEYAAETFFGTYHGKAHALGSEIAASCADCHGAHGMLPADDPGSMVHEANLVETCGDCHENARPAFVKYDSHPDPMNRERNPALFYSFWFMNSLLLGTLTVFGLHTLLWWVRATIDKRRGVSYHGHGGGSHHGGGGGE